MVTKRRFSEETLKALKKLGFMEGMPHQYCVEVGQFHEMYLYEPYRDFCLTTKKYVWRKVSIHFSVSHHYPHKDKEEAKLKTDVKELEQIYYKVLEILDKQYGKKN